MKKSPKSGVKIVLLATTSTVGQIRKAANLTSYYKYSTQNLAKAAQDGFNKVVIGAAAFSVFSGYKIGQPGAVKSKSHMTFLTLSLLGICLVTGTAANAKVINQKVLPPDAITDSFFVVDTSLTFQKSDPITCDSVFSKYASIFNDDADFVRFVNKNEIEFIDFSQCEENSKNEIDFEIYTRILTSSETASRFTEQFLSKLNGAPFVDSHHSIASHKIDVFRTEMCLTLKSIDSNRSKDELALGCVTVDFPKFDDDLFWFDFQDLKSTAERFLLAAGADQDLVESALAMLPQVKSVFGSSRTTLISHDGLIDGSMPGWAGDLICSDNRCY